MWSGNAGRAEEEGGEEEERWRSAERECGGGREERERSERKGARMERRGDRGRERSLKHVLLNNTLLLNKHVLRNNTTLLYHNIRPYKHVLTCKHGITLGGH